MTAEAPDGAGLGADGLIDAALRADPSGVDTARKILTAVQAASGGELGDDATAVCLSVDSGNGQS